MTSTLSVCIVDDSVDYCLIVKQLFSRFLPAYRVSFFTDGRYFLNGLPQLESLPGLIMVDRHMPILNGHQLLLFLKEHPIYQNIPVIMMSTDASVDEINESYKAGVNSFIRKTIDFNCRIEQLTVICEYWLELNQ